MTHEDTIRVVKLARFVKEHDNQCEVVDAHTLNIGSWCGFPNGDLEMIWEHVPATLRDVKAHLGY